MVKHKTSPGEGMSSYAPVRYLPDKGPGRLERALCFVAAVLLDACGVDVLPDDMRGQHLTRAELARRERAVVQEVKRDLEHGRDPS